MTFKIEAWQRLQSDDTPIWVRPANGDWFVPNDAGDSALRALAAGEGAESVEVARFLARLPDGPGLAPPPRAEVLELDRLIELWLHITDRCNLACRHCLFSCSPRGGAELATARVLQLAEEASNLGCRLFALTGGEPMVHGEFVAIVDGLLELPEAHVVILTNGLLIDEQVEALRRWPAERLHLQVSLDGLRAANDRVRGPGNFDRLLEQLATLRRIGQRFTLSLAVTADNVDELADVVALAVEQGASNVHCMWHFTRGRGRREQQATTARIAAALRVAASKAEELGIGLDNIDALRSQVFAPSGTVHDGTNAGWESLAVGPTGEVFPTAAMVGYDAMATSSDGGLERAWRESPRLAEVRQLSSRDAKQPLSALLGGGDIDHRLLGGGSLGAPDPYQPLYDALALWLIVREAEPGPRGGPPALRLKRGDVLESCGAHGELALTHSNCLLAVASEDSRRAVREFYSAAAETPDEDIRNPVNYPEDLIEHIPDEARVRSYGCGSPVLDADPAPGQVLVDLGSGTGVECFIAARLVGATGQVIGVDMLDPMLRRARAGAEQVAQRLGYENLRFEKGFLEQLPLDDDAVDVMISNCVINLSVHKRRTFAEVFRALRPGGRLVVSDVVCEQEPPAAIRNDDTLKGECIGGALTQRDLFGLLAESGFVGARALRRFPYREVGGHPFFSLTFEAFKPATDAASTERVRVMPRGPAPALVTPSGRTLFTGEVVEMSAVEAERLGESVFVLDEEGAVSNLDLGASSCCCVAPDEGEAGEAPSPCCCGPSTDTPKPQLLPIAPAPCCGDSTSERREVDCMICGAPLEYFDVPRETRCYYCGAEGETQTLCREGHFVCDRCHSAESMPVVEHICATTSETDMVTLFQLVRAHPKVPIHGPEHHALIPAVMVATYRNLGGELPPDALKTALTRGAQVPGGFCGFAGGCGAGLGVGIGFAAILGSTPLAATKRQQVISAVATALTTLGEFEAARCCQRDGIVALQRAAEISRELLPIPLRAEERVLCRQVSKNKECLGRACPFYPTRERRRAVESSVD